MKLHKTCPECLRTWPRDEFAAHFNSGRRICKDCRNRARRKYPDGRPKRFMEPLTPAWRDCAYCGRSFKPYHRQIYCTSVCERKAWNARRRKHPPHPYVPKALRCSRCWREREDLSRKLCQKCRDRVNREMHKRCAWIQEIKLAGACTDCGASFSDPRELHFDHLPKYTKVSEIATMVTKGGYTREEIEAEIAKCELVCKNCHIERHKIRLANQERVPLRG